MKIASPRLWRSLTLIENVVDIRCATSIPNMLSIAPHLGNEWANNRHFVRHVEESVEAPYQTESLHVMWCWNFGGRFGGSRIEVFVQYVLWYIIHDSRLVKPTSSSHHGWEFTQDNQGLPSPKSWHFITTQHLEYNSWIRRKHGCPARC